MIWARLTPTGRLRTSGSALSIGVQRGNRYSVADAALRFRASLSRTDMAAYCASLRRRLPSPRDREE